MYKVNLTFTNPVTGDTQALVFQFDPATLTQAKWNAAFPAVQGALATLQARSQPLEPLTW